MMVKPAKREQDVFATHDARWRAVRERDRRAAAAFVYAVTTTGVVCRPGCSSRTPRRENVAFFASLPEAVRAGYRPCVRCCASAAPSPAVRAVARACQLFDTHPESARSTEVARAVGLTPDRLVRAFRAWLGITPQQFRRRRQVERARGALASSATVTEAVYAAGYSASSRFYESAGRELGMSPRRARSGGRGEVVKYAVRPTSLGPVGIAWTARGVCDVFFADDAGDAEAQLRQRFPAATHRGAHAPGWLAKVVALVERPTAVHLPLDIQGTAFQERVWQALRRIPVGETRSYSDVAREIGAARAQRAVARAIGQNRLAVLVPCHRVVGKGGHLTGYRWGLERKRELLRREEQDVP